jgi:PAS domain S-box-containing protein
MNPLKGPWEDEQAGRRRSRRRRSDVSAAHILERITDEFSALDLAWRFTYVNEAALNALRRALGAELTAADVLGKNVWELLPGHVGSVLDQKYHEAMREQKTLEFEARSGITGRWMEARLYPSDAGLSVYTRDITERKQAEARLAYHAYLLDNVYDAVIATDERLAVTAWNKSAEQMYGWRADEALGRHIWDVVAVALTEDQRAAALGSLDERGQFRAETLTYRKDGSPVYVEGITIALRGEQEPGEIVGYVNIRRDITERKRVEESRNELMRRLLAAQEDERGRISRELHDDFGQRVSALGLMLATLRRDHSEYPQFRAQLASLEAIVKELDSDVDLIAWRLRPVALDDLGLGDALKSYVDDWSKYFNVPAAVHVNGNDVNRLTEERETALYRITQEALNNVAKHAHARHVSIVLQRAPHHVSLIVEDDGVGFDHERVTAAHDKQLGLVGMRERASLLGGTLDVESAPGHGTTVLARIPALVR